MTAKIEKTCISKPLALIIVPSGLIFTPDDLATKPPLTLTDLAVLMFLSEGSVASQA